jgi:hypothetical protein
MPPDAAGTFLLSMALASITPKEASLYISSGEQRLQRN